jgi:hypothetical protein
VHLTDAEFIEHLDGALRPERAAHLASCERCRRDAEGLAATLTDARSVDSPEPSPLFWDHFSAQVREAIDQPAASRLSAFVNALRRPGPALAGAAIVALLVVTAGFWPRDLRPPGVHPPSGPYVMEDPLPPPPDRPLATALESDFEWSFVASMADGIDWDAADAAGLSVRPGAAERAAMQLSHDEQQELARLLREHVGGDGSL